MAKRFSVVDYGGDKPKVVSGFIEPETLNNIPEVLEVLSNTSTYERVEMSIIHMLYLDFEDTPITDATAKEVEILQNELPSFYDEGIIEEVEMIELTVKGISRDTEIVEAGDI